VEARAHEDARARETSLGRLTSVTRGCGTADARAANMFGRDRSSARRSAGMQGVALDTSSSDAFIKNLRIH
jgi:hypothetical protein